MPRVHVSVKIQIVLGVVVWAEFVIVSEKYTNYDINHCF